MFKPNRNEVCILKRWDRPLRFFGNCCLVFIVKWYFSHPITALPFAETHEWSSVWVRKEMDTEVGAPRLTPRPHPCLPGAPDHKRGDAWQPCPVRFFQEHRVSTKWLTWQSAYFSSPRSAKKKLSHETEAVRKLFWVLHTSNAGPFLNEWTVLLHPRWFSSWDMSRDSWCPWLVLHSVLILSNCSRLGCLPFFFPSCFLAGLIQLCFSSLCHAQVFTSTPSAPRPLWSSGRPFEAGRVAFGVSSVVAALQSLCHVPPWTAACQAPLSSTVSQSCSNSCPVSQWCHPTISPSVTHFSSCLQSFPASGSFPTRHLFATGGQRVGGSASASVLPMNTESFL